MKRKSKQIKTVKEVTSFEREEDECKEEEDHKKRRRKRMKRKIADKHNKGKIREIYF